MAHPPVGLSVSPFCFETSPRSVGLSTFQSSCLVVVFFLFFVLALRFRWGWWILICGRIAQFLSFFLQILVSLAASHDKPVQLIPSSVAVVEPGSSRFLRCVRGKPVHSTHSWTLTVSAHVRVAIAAKYQGRFFGCSCNFIFKVTPEIIPEWLVDRYESEVVDLNCCDSFVPAFLLVAHDPGFQSVSV